jgi:hypothetical protein
MDRLELVPAAGVIREVSRQVIPEVVLYALRELRAVREEHARKLSASDRLILAECLDLQARYLSLEARIDAAG